MNAKRNYVVKFYDANGAYLSTWAGKAANYGEAASRALARNKPIGAKLAKCMIDGDNMKTKRVAV